MAKILIGDDSWLIRQMLTKYLTKAGYEVVAAENGAGVLDLYPKEKPDCIILDLLMPDIGGLDVLKKLKTMNLKTHVLILTADIQSTTRQRCIDEGVFDFLIKPPNEENILYKVKVAIESNRDSIP